MSVLDVPGPDDHLRHEGGPVPAVRGVSFAIERGQVLGWPGSPGCGKSTIGLGLAAAAAARHAVYGPGAS